VNSEAFVIEMPLKAGYAAAGHRLSTRSGIIVRVAADGLAGWGEFVEIPGYSRETVETALARLSGAPVTHSNPMAIAALRTAELDLEAKQRGVPLTELLGGAVVARFGDLAGTLEEAAGRLADGYRKIKIKIGPGFDVEVLTALRNEHPGIPLAADANGSYQPGAVPPAIDDAGLLYLEQPYPPETPWDAFARLRAGLATPICLDESITGPPTLRAAIAGGACDIINLKPARFTGLRPARELYDMAVAAGLGLVAGGLLETGVGRAATAALARLPGFIFPADLSASDRYWERDLIDPPWTLTDGNLTVSDGAGIGVEVDTAFLEEVTVSHLSLGS
jgi:O-succinylbenzoate synthase